MELKYTYVLMAVEGNPRPSQDTCANPGENGSIKIRYIWTRYPKTLVCTRGLFVNALQRIQWCHWIKIASLQWRHNGCDGVSNHQRLDCILNRLFGRRSKKTSKLRVTDLCEGNSPVTGQFPAQMASNAENFYTWWRHHVMSPWV